MGSLTTRRDRKNASLLQAPLFLAGAGVVGWLSGFQLTGFLGGLLIGLTAVGVFHLFRYGFYRR